MPIYYMLMPPEKTTDTDIMNRILLICFTLIAAFIYPAGAENCTRYGDEAYGYSICVPGGWAKTYRDIGYKHIFSLTRGSSEIVSSASRMDDEEKAKWKSWEKWYVKGIGGGLMNIIETREVQAGRDATIKLIVFQFSRRGTTLLQRSMLMKYRDNLLVVECRAPVGSFSRQTDLFNMVMSSVDVASAVKGNSMDVLKLADTRKKTQGETRGREEKKGSQTEKDRMRDLEKGGILNKIEDGTAPPDGSGKKEERVEEPKPDKKEEPQPVKRDEVKPDNTPESLERKKVIEEELKKLDGLEKKGVIEKVEESGK
jgi:hypothetical protein